MNSVMADNTTEQGTKETNQIYTSPVEELMDIRKRLGSLPTPEQLVQINKSAEAQRPAMEANMKYNIEKYGSALGYLDECYSCGRIDCKGDCDSEDD